MSQETTTQLLGLPTEYGVPGEDGKAFSAAEVDQRSASRMLRVLMLFAWALAGVVWVSAFLGYGTEFSNLLAGGWFAVLSVLLLAWPRMNRLWHRGITVVILMLIVIRWSVSWLYAEPADAMIGVMIGLLYTPVLVIITTLLWGRLSLYIGAGTGLVMGLVAYMGSSREVLAGAISMTGASVRWSRTSTDYSPGFWAFGYANVTSCEKRQSVLIDCARLPIPTP